MVILNVICFMFAHKDWIQKKQLVELAAIDPLIGVGNRRALSESVEKLLSSQLQKLYMGVSDQQIICIVKAGKNLSL
jgi:GGDEF domain-containing protein